MSLQNIVTSLRKFRSLHRWIGIFAATFLIISAVTGLLLGWKKNVDLLQPPMQKAEDISVANWKSVHEITQSAIHAIDSVTGRKIEIDRLDVRLDKGIVKVLFAEGYWEVQVDGGTAKSLSVAQRHSDWIEHVHDGSIINDTFKLIYTNYIGLSLLCLALTGLWLWYGPKSLRKAKNS